MTSVPHSADRTFVRLHEELSAREVVQAANHTGVELRDRYIEPMYTLPVANAELRTKLQELETGDTATLPNVRRITERMRRQFGLDHAVPTFSDDTVVHLGGPSGGGKSMMGNRLGTDIGTPVVDGDVLHTQAAVDTMHDNGTLTNDYRTQEWLPRMEAVVKHLRKELGLPPVLVCSALTDVVRMELERIFGVHTAVYCAAPYDELNRRLAARAHPYIQADSGVFLANQWQNWEHTLPQITGRARTLIVDTSKDDYAEALAFVRGT